MGGFDSLALPPLFAGPSRPELTTPLWRRVGQLKRPRSRAIAVLRGHTGGVSRALFSPDGSRIVTASRDRTARLWDAEGRAVAALRGHDGPVYSAVFSPDGLRVLTASKDGTARVWLVHTENLLALAEERLTRDFDDQEREQYAGLLDDAVRR